VEKKSEFRVLSATAILGYGFPLESFHKGLEMKPDLIAVDGGSTDPGPYYLGSGKAFTDREMVKRDLLHMIKAGKELGVPVVVGTAGGSGAEPHLRWCADIVEEIFQEEGFTLKTALIPADIPKEMVIRYIKEGRVKTPQWGPDLDEAILEKVPYLVAQMGVEPFQEALEQGAELVLAGRAYDPAVFAALPIMRGFDPGLAIHMGKILECAAIAAEPGSGSDSVLGILRADHFELIPLTKGRKFTRTSTAAHTMYEKENPYKLPGPGGVLDISNSKFNELSEGRVQVEGSRFLPDRERWIKIEGSAPRGYRTLCVAGLRDSIMIRQLPDILDFIKSKVVEVFGSNASEALNFKAYGLDGVMGEHEPEPEAHAKEVGLILEAVAETQDQANSLCSFARSTLLHYGYPGRISTAGNLALPFSPSDIPMGMVYDFAVYHLIPEEGIEFPINWRH
jgi:hypothetical protein